MQLMTCDTCHTEFKLKKTKFKLLKNTADGNVRVQYFSCPECGKKYVVSVENEKLKNMVKEIKKLRRNYLQELKKKELPKNPDEKTKAEEMLEQYEKMKTENMRLNKHLKFLYSKNV